MGFMELHGILASGSTLLSTLYLLTGLLLFAFVGAKMLLWSVYVVAAMWVLGFSPILCGIVTALLVLFNVPPLRQALISNGIFKTLKSLNLLPAISETERIALEAGATWVDGELFSGKPNFTRLQNEPYNKVSGEELEFINNQCEVLCKMADDWNIYQSEDLPKEVWDYIKKEKFFGMIVPKEYGGLGFSAIANSEVVHKLSSRSLPLGITVMVPNSLGPAELLIHYGTDAQKDHYLPRLASGEEIPCFALTEPGAGSDAGSITSHGVVTKGEDGKLYIRLNWEKRYITLAAVSTLIGLAVKVTDPDHLLGEEEDLGITCVLVPANTPGVQLGRRHNPMGVPFYNCPTNGENVVVSIDQVIGGQEGVGKGWLMLMESLAAGRSISLPAQSTGGAKSVARVTTAYAMIRQQFGIQIGRFEGIEEPLARVLGLTYLLEASRIYTCGAVDQGIKPSVVSAIAKCYSTELSRVLINDGMDILGGAGISRGPRNTLANGYIAAPIGITVEGANILTRTMIIFGQGAIRCHPYAYQEMKAILSGDAKGFDRSFWAHVGFVARNAARALLLSLTRGFLGSYPGGPLARYYRKLSWSSASFAFLADVALGTLGGQLKMKEKITGRFADILSWMYLANAVMRRFEAEGRNPEHLPYAQWSLQYAFKQIQEAFDGLYGNLDIPVLGAIFKYPVRLWSRFNTLGFSPDDKLGQQLCYGATTPGAVRDALTKGIFISEDEKDALGRYENAFKLITEAGKVYAKVRKAVHKKQLPKMKGPGLLKVALEKGVLTKEEFDLAERAETARIDAVQVDSFELGSFNTGLLGYRKGA